MNISIKKTDRNSESCLDMRRQSKFEKKVHRKIIVNSLSWTVGWLYSLTNSWLISLHKKNTMNKKPQQ